MASNASLSSEDSGDSDIDSKAEKFIAQFRSRLKFEKESDSVLVFVSKQSVDEENDVTTYFVLLYIDLFLHMCTTSLI